MAWIKIDALISSHPVVHEVGDEALGLWLRLGGWLATFPKQGNFIPGHVAKHYGKRRLVNALVTSGMWVEVDGGYEMYQKMDLASCGHTTDLWVIDKAETRRKIADQIRHAIYERDEYACVDCGATDDLTLDHIFPWSLGGSDDYDNLRTLCRPCNSRKGARV